jgi:exopolysaccharide biosynthesis polyprenyl glycosylphosphotransferase
VSPHVASEGIPEVSGTRSGGRQESQPPRLAAISPVPSRLRHWSDLLAASSGPGIAYVSASRAPHGFRLTSAQRFTLLLVTIDLNIALGVFTIYIVGSAAHSLPELLLPLTWLAVWFVCSGATGGFSQLGGFSSRRGFASSLNLSARSGAAALAACTLMTVVLGSGPDQLKFVAVIVALTLISGLARVLLARFSPPRVIVVTREHEPPPLSSTSAAIVGHLSVSAAQIAEPRSLIAEISAQARDSDASAVELVGDLGLSGPLRSSLSWELRNQHASLRFPMEGGSLRQRRVHCAVRGGIAVLEIAAPTQALGARLAKRTMDIVGAAVLLITLSPMLLLLAVAVKASGPGPALYKQARVGRDGRMFKILKFRSMAEGSDTQLHMLLRSQNKDAKPLFKIDNDPRITPVGAVLRRYSLDELPQLLNVLVGSMSLVGPRPQRPAEVALYRGDAVQRLGVRPGMTGLWQVNGRSRLTWEQAQQMDLDYVHNWSIWEDLHIMGRTARAVIAGDGAQ